MLEFNCASACQSESAEGKGGGQGKGSEWHQSCLWYSVDRENKQTNKKTQALSCRLKLFIAPPPHSRSPPKAEIINLSPFSPIKREAGTKNIPAKSAFLKDFKLPNANGGKNSLEAERLINK